MKFKFCPNCKNRIKEKQDMYTCSSCGMRVYKDSSPTSSAVILKDNKVLVAIRALEPKKGLYDLPGGFLDPGEHPEKGVKREVKEETGLDIKLKDLLGVYMGKYQHQGQFNNTLNFYYAAGVVSGNLKPEDDVEEIKWVKTDKLSGIDFAFEHQNQVVKDFLDWHKENK